MVLLLLFCFGVDFSAFCHEKKKKLSCFVGTVQFLKFNLFNENKNDHQFIVQVEILKPNQLASSIESKLFDLYLEEKKKKRSKYYCAYNLLVGLQSIECALNL